MRRGNLQDLPLRTATAGEEVAAAAAGSGAAAVDLRPVTAALLQQPPAMQMVK